MDIGNAVFFGAVASAILGGLAYGWTSDKSTKVKENEHNEKLRKVLELREQHALARENALAREESRLNELKSQFDAGYLQGRKWLAKYIAEMDKTLDDGVVSTLISKSKPAYKAAEVTSLANAEKRKWKERAKFLEYQLISYKEYFPFLEEYEDAILDEAISLSGHDAQELTENTDPVHKYLNKEEYAKLSETQRNQLALDRYLSSNLSPSAIGRQYERYLGAIFEAEGYSVEYHGIVKGLEDLGRDLICRRGNEIAVVQAKCWAATKTIHEKHIFQLFGTTLLFRMQSGSGTVVTPHFYTTTKLSEVARSAADALGVVVREEFQLRKDFPLIKCNINKSCGERIYHLPFDQQYERTVIEKSTGEFFAKTVAEAESKGFRRAKRYFGPSG